MMLDQGSKVVICRGNIPRFQIPAVKLAGIHIIRNLLWLDIFNEKLEELLHQNHQEFSTRSIRYMTLGAFLLSFSAAI